MMKKPILVIMAAGMGSRYGGLKQIDHIDSEGHIIIDFSIYDAIKAGFDKLVFIIKKEDEQDFKHVIGNRISKRVQVEYVYQDLHNLPKGYMVPEKRVKPWGTAHAVLCCKDVVDGPFTVINADDYYGQEAFKLIYDYLAAGEDRESPLHLRSAECSRDDKYRFAMVGYALENTLTENGYVARGVCKTDDNGYLVDIQERTHIEKREDGAVYTEDEGKTWVSLPPDSIVSMNMWGFTPDLIKEAEAQFSDFLNKNLTANPLKCEYFLPAVVGELLHEDRASVQILSSLDKWYGVTYKEDKAVVVNALQQLKDSGKYPAQLWGD